MYAYNMTRRIRRIFLYSITLFFILAAPAALFYAWGYSFDWQKKRPVLTGGLYLKSIPKKADVYINDKLKDQTPAFVKRLIPREYQVKVVKEGFHSWQKKMRVESKLVTEAKNILLIPLVPNIEIIEGNLSENFSLEKYLDIQKSNDIFYVQKPSYILYKTDSFNLSQEQISSTPLPADCDYEIFASLNGRIATLSDKNELYLLNPQTRTFKLISQDVKGLQFSNDNKLLYFTSSEIWAYYLEDIFSQPNKKADNKELITRISQEIKQVIWYDETNEHIIFLVGQNIKIIELDGRNKRNIIDIIKTNIDQIAYSSKDNKLYFVKEIEEQSSELWGLSLE
ncbi:MAG: PEGA domain-containing protein [Parcubacteria group bacterium]|nr:PEGA domain-containing protein [Parcubacteria group bacterium]